MMNALRTSELRVLMLVLEILAEGRVAWRYHRRARPLGRRGARKNLVPGIVKEPPLGANARHLAVDDDG